MALSLQDRLALGAIQAALNDARDARDSRPPLEVLTDSLAEIRKRGISPKPASALAIRERDAWLVQMQHARRSKTMTDQKDPPRRRLAHDPTTAEQNPL